MLKNSTGNFIIVKLSFYVTMRRVSTQFRVYKKHQRRFTWVRGWPDLIPGTIAGLNRTGYKIFCDMIFFSIKKIKIKSSYLGYLLVDNNTTFKTTVLQT